MKIIQKLKFKNQNGSVKLKMDSTSIKAIKELLEKRHTKPKKGLGQNFLIDKNALANIIQAADIQPQDTVLEIGPGIGILTHALAQKAKEVIAVEKDGAMLEILKETLKDCPNVKILQGDALRYDAGLKIYKIVANLPYYITSPIIRKFLEEKNQPTVMALMVQKEVAQRICAKPPRMSILSVSAQFYAEPKIIAYVSKEKFWPAPKVDSAIIKIIPHTRQEKIDANLFFKIIKAGFLHPRKQLANNLSVALKKEREEIQDWLTKNNIAPAQRAETLAMQDWLNLTKSF